MENIAALLLPALLAVLLVRMLLRPAGLALKLAAHALGGFLCLWVLNTVSGFTGLCLPVNAVTVASAGFLGLPGIALVVLLELAA